MKSTNLILLLLGFSLLFSCKGKKSDGSISGGDDSTYAVCLWDKASLKESPEKSGKWIESVSLGEKCEFLGDTKETNEGSKTVKYYKIKLLGGKEGWVQASLFAIASKPATLTEEAEVFTRPDLLTRTNRRFSKMDIVAVKSVQGEFIEITGKRQNGEWIETGWIKSTNISYLDVDIAVAKFATKALAIKDPEKQKEALNEIINNTDYSSSVFIGELNEIANPASLNEDEEGSGDMEAEEDSTSSGE